MYIIKTTELWQVGYSYSNHKPTIQTIDARARAIHWDNIGGFRICKLRKKEMV